MKYNFINECIILEEFDSFNPRDIFECGQAFRWYLEEDGSYTFIVKNKVVNVIKEDEKVYFRNIDIDFFENVLIEYFDFNTDYNDIKKKLSKIDKHLDEATKFGSGIRILKQDKFEMIISFIISANNRIPMIKKAVEGLSEKFGKFIGKYNGKKYYSFPTVESLANAKIEELRVSGVGFRDKYISNTSKMIFNKDIDLEKISEMSKENIKKSLMKLSGVGPKVAECVMLFSFNKMSSFPIDTWVKKVVEEYYSLNGANFKQIEEFSKEYFGKYAGYAQQYLFYYARENFKK